MRSKGVGLSVGVSVFGFPRNERCSPFDRNYTDWVEFRMPTFRWRHLLLPIQIYAGPAASCAQHVVVIPGVSNKSKAIWEISDSIWNWRRRDALAKPNWCIQICGGVWRAINESDVNVCWGICVNRNWWCRRVVFWKMYLWPNGVQNLKMY